MIRTAKVIFCDNEHGTGDMTFPDLDGLARIELQQQFIVPRRIGELRKAAKKEGWGRINGGDYCASCMEAER
jgi:hypothetical protein